MPKQPLKHLWLWLFPFVVSASFVHWEGNYDTARQKAHKTHKPLLVFIVKQNSDNTREAIQTVFMNQPYVETINEKTVAVMVTYEVSQNYPVEMYYTTVFPTLFFVDAQKELFLRKPLYGNEITKESVGQSLHRMVGRESAD